MMLLKMTSLVFAKDVSPTAIGIGDTKEQAITLLPEQDNVLFLSNAKDQDWYVCKNTTGSDKYMIAYIDPNQAPNTAFRLGAQLVYANGSQSTIMYSEYGTVGQWQTVGLTVPAWSYFLCGSRFSYF